jgi:hypothetical protein
LNGVRVKLAHDLYYLERVGPWLDARIVAATGLHVLGMPYAWTGRLCALPGGPDVAGRLQARAPVGGIVADLQAV